MEHDRFDIKHNAPESGEPINKMSIEHETIGHKIEHDPNDTNDKQEC